MRGILFAVVIIVAVIASINAAQAAMTGATAPQVFLWAMMALAMLLPQGKGARTDEPIYYDPWVEEAQEKEDAEWEAAIAAAHQREEGWEAFHELRELVEGMRLERLANEATVELDRVVSCPRNLGELEVSLRMRGETSFLPPLGESLKARRVSGANGWLPPSLGVSPVRI